MKDWLKFSFIERRKQELMDELYPLVVDYTEKYHGKNVPADILDRMKKLEERIYYLDDLLRNRKGGH